MNRPYTPASTDSELLPVVDAEDRVIGSATRREVHERGLLHRGVHIVIVNSAEEILLQLRSAAKDLYPGWWDISVGGHVDAGEEYEAAVVRELREEMGIAAPTVLVETLKASPQTGWEFQRIYECRWDGAVAPSKSEIDAVRWESLATIRAMGTTHEAEPGNRLTPGGLLSIDAWARATGRL